MSASSLRILTLGYSFVSCLSTSTGHDLQSARRLLSRLSESLSVFSMPIWKMDSNLFSSFDEPGKSREARELTWEVQGLSMRRSGMDSVQSDVPNHNESIAPVLLCRQKRGVHLPLHRTLSNDSPFDRLMTNPETLQNQPVGLVLSDLLTLSTTILFN